MTVARRDDPPKAIINFVRGWDYTMLQALHSAGLRVPEDVYLTGLDVTTLRRTSATPCSIYRL